MSYDEKLALVKIAIIKDCKKRISDNWGQMFDMWLDMEADHEFGSAYKAAFNEQFSKYMNEDLESLLWQSGQNILYAICSFQQYFPKANLGNVQDYLEFFIERQIDGFTDCCDDIQMAMYDEAHPESSSPTTN